MPAEAACKVNTKLFLVESESKRDVPVSMEGKDGRGNFQDK